MQRILTISWMSVAVWVFTAPSACAEGKEIAYNPEIKSPIEFGKSVVGPLSGGLGKWLGKLNNKVTEDGGMRKFEARIVPTDGPESIVKSFANYCAGVGGVFDQNLCADERESMAYFYIRILKAPPPAESAYDFEVYEPKAAPGTDVVDLARSYGYQYRWQKPDETLANAKALAQMKAEERRSADEQERQRQQAAELARRQGLSRATRSQVMQRGTRVCMVDSNACDLMLCSIDDANAVNAKVRVLLGDRAMWAGVDRWFACE